MRMITTQTRRVCRVWRTGTHPDQVEGMFPEHAVGQRDAGGGGGNGLLEIGGEVDDGAAEGAAAAAGGGLGRATRFFGGGFRTFFGGTAGCSSTKTGFWSKSVTIGAVPSEFGGPWCWAVCSVTDCGR